MSSTTVSIARASVLIALGVAIAAMGIYVAEADDAPGAAVIGFLLMLAAVVLGIRAARNRLPDWAGRAALAVGLVVAGLAASITHAVTIAAPLFAVPPDVPSVSATDPGSQWTAAVERARSIVRTAIVDDNLPGVSVAVGVDGHIVWVEGFGWRDAGTQTPVTPDTRFHIGTAASAVTPAAVARLGLAHTGTDAAFAWSPEAIGEPGEDFPPFTLVRHLILQPLGLAPAEYPLPGQRATFYVPRSDDDPRHGRRLMPMRALACCADDQAFASTPSDLVRFAMATHAGDIHGDLAGGRVTSVVTRPGSSIPGSLTGTLVVAVSSNIAHASTDRIADGIADAFGAQK